MAVAPDPEKVLGKLSMMGLYLFYSFHQLIAKKTEVIDLLWESCSRLRRLLRNYKSPMDILVLLQSIQDCLSKTTVQQMNRVTLAMTGRVTMLGISRWAGEDESYRTIQRFYTTVIPWENGFWQLFMILLMQKDTVYILVGDECMVSKTGKKTFGWIVSLQVCNNGHPQPIIFSSTIP
jgi:hypothetical protein